MSSEFPEFACPYSQRLAASSRRFARQVYDACSQSKRSRVLFLYGLIMTSDRCFMNCRHCTRQGLLGQAQVVKTDEQLKGCVDYVKAHPKVRDVLLSGGDILTLSDREVLRFVDAFAALPQVELVRVCTRAPSTNPGRITAKLAKALGKSKKVWVNTQFNCADEVTSEARHAAALLVEAGIPVSCQTVLLKGVNDSATEMLKLLRALTAARIRPYYVFTCDPIAGIDHFRVPVEKAREIERKCAESIGGLALPRFVSDIPGAKRKVPVSAAR